MFKRLIALLFVLSPLTAQALECGEFDPAALNVESFTESPASTNPTKGIVLIAHGLNLNPAKMQLIANFLQAAGYHTLLARLSGHQSSNQGWQDVSYARWHEEMSALHCVAALRARQQNVPLIFLGYSLGAVLGLDTLAALSTDPTRNESRQEGYSKIVLLAPALALNWYSNLALQVPLLPDSLQFSSLSPADYRANATTSVGAYRALSESIAIWQQESTAARIDSPVLALMDPQDELISYKALRSKISRGAWKNWQLVELNNDASTLDSPIHHLVIDEASLGSQQWKFLQDTVLAFLDEH